jgi:hypothetical protein
MDDISIVNLCWMKYSEFYWGVPDFDRFLYLKLGFPLILRTLKRKVPYQETTG